MGLLGGMKSMMSKSPMSLPGMNKIGKLALKAAPTNKMIPPGMGGMMNQMGNQIGKMGLGPSPNVVKPPIPNSPQANMSPNLPPMAQSSEPMQDMSQVNQPVQPEQMRPELNEPMAQPMSQFGQPGGMNRPNIGPSPVNYRQMLQQMMQNRNMNRNNSMM